MDNNKKSIVSYDDDDDEVSGNDEIKTWKRQRNSREDHRFSTSKHDRSNNKDLKSYGNSSSHHHEHNRHHRFHLSRDHSKSRSRRHQHHYRSSKSPPAGHRHRGHRSRSQSRSRNRDSSHQKSRKHHGSCRKSKRDRSHSRTKESNYSHHHRHRSPRSHSMEKIKESKQKTVDNKVHVQPEIKGVEVHKIKPAIVAATTTVPNKIEIPTKTATNIQFTGMLSKESVLNPICTQQQQLDIPKYYNSKVVNPSRIAEQVEKRKLLWGDTKKEKTSTIWTNLKFQGEHGSAMTEKFRKLMGIKSTNNETDTTENNETIVTKKESNINADDVSSNQAKLFENLDMQYSIARMSTHLNRGVGLGFGNTAFK